MGPVEIFQKTTIEANALISRNTTPAFPVHPFCTSTWKRVGVVEMGTGQINAVKQTQGSFVHTKTEKGWLRTKKTP